MNHLRMVNRRWQVRARWNKQQAVVHHLHPITVITTIYLLKTVLPENDDDK